MSRWRVLVVDDEPLARRGIMARLTRHRQFEVVGEAGDVASAVSELRKRKPDLVFLDIQMPGTDGFAVLDAIPVAELPLVVFVTAHDDRAVQAFEREAFDYVLKPLDDRRFARVLERVVARLTERGGTGPDRIIIRDRGRAVALDPAAIDWVKSDGDYVRIHVGPSSYLHHGTLSAFEALLPANRFARVHRGAIVNVARIQSLEPLTNGDYSIRLATGARLRLSRTYRGALARRVGTRL